MKTFFVILFAAFVTNAATYAPEPNDPYFDGILDGFRMQWYLENRLNDPAPLGIDINARSAWAVSRGEGVVVAVVDSGVELSHPDLVNQQLTNLHYNFAYDRADGTPIGTTASWAHGTEAAGLIVARANNNRGISGVAPAARFVSWGIVRSNLTFPPDEILSRVYTNALQQVHVQNHSWGSDKLYPNGPGPLEHLSISNAVRFGRNGKGTVMVRSGGNLAGVGGDVNDDGYASDPRAISVAATDMTGRASPEAVRGASLLVAAPSRDFYGNGLFTTDMVGTRGANQINFGNDLNDYVFRVFAFRGTSAAAPLVSGIAALVLSANPELTWRDVQQVILHSARHYDFQDADVRTNAAGYLASHHVGFGIPDAGQAVRLAQRWVNRPPQEDLKFRSSEVIAIPDTGLRLRVSGTSFTNGSNITPALTSQGPHPELLVTPLSLVDLGFGNSPASTEVRGKAALIERDTNSFAAKIQNAAAGGAALAIIFNDEAGNQNCPGGESVCSMGGTEFVSIPALFIARSAGLRLREAIENTTPVMVQIDTLRVGTDFAVTNSLLCEQVGVRIRSNHEARGDLRITLTSPKGTVSVLQRIGPDVRPGPTNWTYYTTHHFYEPSQGEWQVRVLDEIGDFTGSILETELIIKGVTIDDSDTDGLSDEWERGYFTNLNQTAAADPDLDGYSNMKEQILQTDPSTNQILFILHMDQWNLNYYRLSWFASSNYTYSVSSTPDLNIPFTVQTNLVGSFPESFVFVPKTNSAFYRITRTLR